jgi:hypothetical protein
MPRQAAAHALIYKFHEFSRASDAAARDIIRTYDGRELCRCFRKVQE